MSRSNNLFTPFLLTASVFVCGIIAAPQIPKPKHETVAMKGHIIAGVDYPTGFLRGGFGDKFEVFVFGVKQNSAAVNPIKVMFRFFKSEQPLPDSFFDASKRYELQVSREPNCDETVQSLSYQKNSDADGKTLPSSYILHPLGGSPEDMLKPDLMLPCYILRPGKSKLLSQGKKKKSDISVGNPAGGKRRILSFSESAPIETSPSL